MRAPRPRMLGAGVGLVALASVLLGCPVPASASTHQVSIIQDSAAVMNDPGSTLSTFRDLGAGVVRVIVDWAQVAPAARSRTAPAGFDAADPADYPAANWAPYDQIVRLATAEDMQVDFTLSGGAPRWAEGPGIPQAALGNPFWAWRPSAADFGQFARAVGERYSGTYVPAGQTTALPRVSFWAIWNEPNFGEDLGPQAVDGSTIATGPMMYRKLVSQTWNALAATGHGGDTILVGELAPWGLSAHGTARRPQGLPGQFGQTKPLRFLRTLYCVDSAYRPLRGAAATAVGCPASASGSRAFRLTNPGLFEATGLADHPYPHNQPPTIETSSDPDIAPFPRLPNLEGVIDRLQRAYGSRRRLPIYNTEYGYITSPPGHGPAYVSPATAAYYLNWAEYLSWRNPRIASTMQYLLYDPPPVPKALGGGGFASGLVFSSGRPKATYAAYRLPVYLPVTSAPRSRSLEVWGCLRPARYAILDTGQAQTATIEFARGSTGAYSPVASVTVADPTNCYFDLRVRFPGSGTVRLAYTYPAGDPLLGPSGTTVYSRTVAISVP